LLIFFLRDGIDISIGTVLDAAQVKVNILVRLLRYSVPALISQGIQLLEPVLVTAVILSDLGPTQAGIYYAGFAVPSQMVSILLQANSTYLTPKISSVLGSKRGIANLMNEAIRVMLLFWLPFACMMVVFGSSIIRILYQPDFLMAAQFYALQLFGDLGVLLARPLRSGLYPSGHFAAMLGLTISRSALRIAFFLLLIDHGLSGIFLSHVLSSWVILAASFLLSRRYFSFSFAGKSLFLIAKSLAVFLATAVLVYSSNPLLAYGVPCALLMAWLVTALDRREKVEVYSLARQSLQSISRKLRSHHDL
jgi:O-antigen/teichoic acid export membrane protein